MRHPLPSFRTRRPGWRWLLSALCLLTAGPAQAQAPVLTNQQMLGGLGFDRITHSVITADGGTLLYGTSSSPVGGNKTAPTYGDDDIWLVKLDAGGVKQWDRSYGGTDYDFVNRVILTPATGGYLVLGGSYSNAGGNKTTNLTVPTTGINNDNADGWVLKLDANGNKTWEANLGGVLYEDFSGAVPTADGGYLLSGVVDSDAGGDVTLPPIVGANTGNDDYWVVKISATGTKTDERRYGGQQSDYPYGAIPTPGGGLLIYGTSNSGASGTKTSPVKNGNGDGWVVAVDATGAEQWQHSYGGTGSANSSYETPLADGLATTDGGYLFVGTTGANIGPDKTENGRGETDGWVLKIDASGNRQWDKTLGGSSTDMMQCLTPVAGSNGTQFVFGGATYQATDGDISQPGRGLMDGWLIKLTTTATGATKVWDVRYGGTDDDEIAALTQGADGTFTASGASRSSISGDITVANHGGSDALTLRVAEVCSAVTNLSITNITPSLADVTFTAAPGAGNTYTVYYTPSYGGTQSVTTTASPVHLNLLTSNTSYAVRVVTNCADGSTSANATTTFTTQGGCDPPTNVALAFVSGTYIVVTMDAQTNPDNLTYLSITAPGSNTVLNDLNTQYAYGYLYNLTPNTAYTLHVNTYCGGLGADSAPVPPINFTTSASTACAPVTAPAVANVTASSADVSFAPGSNGSLVYKIVYTPTSGAIVKDSLAFVSYPQPARFTSSVTGLQSGMHYDVTIRSECFDGVFGTAVLTSFTTSGGGATCNAVTGLSAGSLTQTSASLSFTPATGATNYTVTYTPQGGTAQMLTATGAPVSLTGLTAGTTYAVSIVTNCSNGGTSTAATTSFTTTAAPAGCSNVTNVSLTNITGTSAQLNFTPVAGAVSYTVDYTRQGGGSMQFVTPTPTASPVMLTGLTPGSSYLVRITTNCAGGGTSSPLSRTFSTTTVVPALAWTGTTSTDWLTAANWNNNAVPTATDDVTIPTNAPRYPVLTTATATAHDLTIAAGATLTLTGGTLDLTGNLTTDGLLTHTAGGLVRLSGATTQTLRGTTARTFRDLTVGAAGASLTGAPTRIARVLTLTGNLTTNGLLTLASDATATAMVVNDGGAALGTATVQRYISPATNAGVGYRHLSSPVAATSVADLTVAGFAPRVNAAYNALPTPTLTAATFPNVFGYDETRGGTTPAYQGFNTGWYSPTALTDGLTTGRGYTVAMAGGLTPDFVGTLHTGTITLTGANALTRTGTVATDPNTSKTGWHLLGNLYPAPLNWDLIPSSAFQSGGAYDGLSGAISVFQSTGLNSGQYLTRVNGTGTLPGGLVAMAQGFFARVTGPEPVSFSFTDALRVTSYQNPAHYRPAADTRPLISLTLRQTGAATAVADEAIVYFAADATAGLDDAFDAPRPGRNLGNVPTLATLSTPAADELAINALSPAALATGVRVPLLLALPAAATYELALGQLLHLDGVTATLEDALTGTRYDLRQQPRVTLTAARPNTEQRNRWTLVLGQRVTGLNPLAATEAATLRLWPNPATTGTTVRLTGIAPGQPLTVTDAAGRRVSAPLTTGTTAGEATLDLQYLPSGVYIVRSGAQVQRLVVE